MMDGTRTTMLIDRATVWPSDGTPPAPGWLAVEAGRIRATGTGPAPPTARTRELRGCHVLPGFVDAHSHLSVGAWIPETLDGSNWSSGAAALGALARHAGARPELPWLVAMRADFDRWRDGVPTLSRLDESVAGRCAIVMDISLHRGWVSSAALAKAGVAIARPKFQDDVERRRGRATGMLWEAAGAAVLKLAFADLARHLGDSGFDALLLAEAERHLSLGITACHDPCIPPALQEHMERLRGRTALRLSWSRVAESGLMQPAAVSELCPDCGDGPASAKLFLDGAHKCAMCLEPGHVMAISARAAGRALLGDPAPLRALLQYRSVYRQGRVYSPYLRMDAGELVERLDTLAAAAVRPKIHALGNHAAACACSALRRTGLRDAAIEHLVVLDDATLDRIAESGAIASLQTGFIEHHGRTLIERGALPRLRALPAASLLARGVPLALSSDHPCAPLDPLLNLRAAVNRRHGDGPVIDAREAIGAQEAVRAYTTGGYRAIHGRPGPGLAAGAPADFVVLSHHPMDLACRVLETWVGGTLAWSADSRRLG